MPPERFRRIVKEALEHLSAQVAAGRPVQRYPRPDGDPKGYLDRLKAIIVKQGLTIAYDPSTAPLLAVTESARIRLFPLLGAAEQFSILAHQLAHELLQHGHDCRSASPAEETQAEAVSYVLCTSIRLDTNTAAADYIALHGGDKTVLAGSLPVVEETSARILEDLLVGPPRAQSLKKESPGPAPGASPRGGEAGPDRADPASRRATDSGPDLSDSMSWER